MPSKRRHLLLSSPEVVQVNHDDPVLAIKVHHDLAGFKTQGYIEPADDMIVNIYSTPRADMVETGDIVYRYHSEEDARFFEVIYASSRPYPLPPCANARLALPYQLFLQLKAITDESDLIELKVETDAVRGLPY